MSILAKYVEITPDRLAELLDEPDEVAELFVETVEMVANERMQAEAARRAPQVLADLLSRVNSSMRGPLETNLKAMGISVEDLQAGRGREALLNFMMQAKGTPIGSGGGAIGSRGRTSGSDAAARLSLDKAWHGLHYLLCGHLDSTPSPLGQVIMGGTEIGDDEMGYGPARHFTPAEVANIAVELSAATLEAQMQGRFDPARMVNLDIYPGGWDSSGLRWLMDEFRNLRAFFVDASSHRAAVVTCLV